MKYALIVIGLIVLVVAGGAFFGTLKQHQNDSISVSGQDIENSQMLASTTKPEIDAYAVEYIPGVTGYFAKPKKDGQYPGVVMVHEWWGLNDNIKQMARELAGEGYEVLAVDLYNGNVATTAEDAQKYVGAVDKAIALKNMQGAVDYLRRAHATKVGSLGWCFGGGQSLALALSGEKLDATALYYGTPLVTDKNQLKNISWPVLGIFGDKDQAIPVAKVNEFKAALDALKVPNSVTVYPGVGHAFANPSGTNYAPNETKDAWAKTLSFLNANLK